MIYRFENFELDTDAFELRRDGAVCPLEPQVFDLLRYLVENPNRLVSRDEILAKIWSGRIVSETALSSRIKAARRAIGDNGRDQRLIRTVHGRGFRFILEAPSVPEIPSRREGRPDRQPLIGRDGDLERLMALRIVAMTDRGHLVFITGDSGIGKSALVRRFVECARQQDRAYAYTGHCVEQSGPAEPYLPVLDALGQLCRADRNAVAAMRQFAPSWLLQFSYLLDDEAIAALHRKIIGVSGDRMLREMSDVLPELSAATPLILVIEDLHWSDASTLELLKSLARRGLPQGLLIIGTFRTPQSDSRAIAVDELARELEARGTCSLIELQGLDRAGTEQFLNRRIGASGLSDGLIDRLLESSSGNPFFMGALVDWWAPRGLLFDLPATATATGMQGAANAHIPPQLLRILGAEFTHLEPEDQTVLEWAAVAGPTFEATTIASVAGYSNDEISDRLTALTGKQQFIRLDAASEDDSDGSVFRFAHALRREVIYWGISASRRRRMHAALGNARMAELGDRARERPAELAGHFLLGGDATKAIPWLLAAAEQATWRGGHAEALASLNRAKASLSQVTDTARRPRWELAIEAAVASNLVETSGIAAPEAEAAYLNAVTLAERHGDTTALSTLLYHLAHIYELRGEFGKTQDLMRQRRALRSSVDVSAIVETAELMACSAFHQGNLRAAVEEANGGLARYEPERHADLIAASGCNVAVSCEAWAARAQCFMGMPDTALFRIERALNIAEREAPYTLCSAHGQAAFLRQHRNERAQTRHHAERVIELGQAHDLPYRVATGTILRGWSVACDCGDARVLEEMERALEVCDRIGVRLEIPFFRGLIAEACLCAGDTERALRILAMAVGSPVGGRGYYYESELHRMRGCAFALSGDHDQAVDAYAQALAIAEDQSAKLSALRVLLSKAKYLKDTGTRTRIESTYRSFDEGLDTPDLKAAAAILGKD